MKYFLLTVLLLTTTINAQKSKKMNTPETASSKFSEFIQKKKFYAENHLPNISDEKLRPILTEKINEVAEAFREVSKSKEPTENKYLEAIRKGLLKFPEVELGFDSEDRERILLYFQELMDIVELKSSNG